MGRPDGFSQQDQVAQIALVACGKVLCALAILGMRGQTERADSGEHSHKGQKHMYKLLIHEGTFARIAADLKTRADHIAPIIIYNDGKFRDSAGNLVENVSDITLAYGTPDVWFSKIALTFVKAVLSADHLAFFQSSAAGIDHPVLESLKDKADIYATSHEQSEAIGEWALWAGFDWLQKGNARRAGQAAKNWQRIEFTEIADTHWLIIGFGAIGQATARKLRALGARVTGVRRTPGAHADADAMITPADLPKVLGKADIVLLALPHTEATENMANADFFTAMGSASLFINVGRGLLVDEAAMLAALDGGQIDHATLDVTAVEPLPEDSPIWSHPNITLTAHLAADTMGSARRTDALFLRNLDGFLSEKPLKNVVSD